MVNFQFWPNCPFTKPTRWPCYMPDNSYRPFLNLSRCCGSLFGHLFIGDRQRSHGLRPLSALQTRRVFEDEVRLLGIVSTVLIYDSVSVLFLDTDPRMQVSGNPDAAVLRSPRQHRLHLCSVMRGCKRLTNAICRDILGAKKLMA